MSRMLMLAGAGLLATAAVAEPFVAPVSGSYTQEFGGFGSDGTEALFEFSVPPLDTSTGTDLIRIEFEGTITQSLSFTFAGSEFGDQSYCGSTFALPGFSLFIGGEPLAAAEVGTGVGVCGNIGEAVSATQAAPVLFETVIDPSNPSFEAFLEGFPLEFVFRDPSMWDLEGLEFDSFVYVTGFDGNIFVEAIGGAPNEVPEPAALGLIGLGALALGLRRRRAVAD